MAATLDVWFEIQEEKAKGRAELLAELKAWVIQDAQACDAYNCGHVISHELMLTKLKSMEVK